MCPYIKYTLGANGEENGGPFYRKNVKLAVVVGQQIRSVRVTFQFC